MSFPFNAYLLSFGGSFLIAAFSMPLWRAWCLHAGLNDDPGHRKIHDKPIPLAVGLAVATGILLPLIGGAAVVQLGLLNVSVSAPLEHGFGRRIFQLAAIGGGALGMVLLGWFDDKHELKAGPKFIGQLLIAFLVAASGIRITLFVDNLLFSHAITILWILTLTNAMNFMDNMNGLCSGLGVLASGSFALAAAAQGQYLVCLLALSACGALLGFLPYNFPRARAFLGDSGSHLVGYLLAVLAIMPHFYTSGGASTWAVLSPLFILAVPLGDLVSVVIIRWRLGKPFYIGDNNHLSHQLTRRGFSRTRAVLLIWLLAAIIDALAFFLFNIGH